MIDWITIIFLIVFGLSLVVAEIIFIPGTTVVGILGFVALVFSVGLSFSYFGSEIGMVVLGSSFISLVLVLFYCFKSGAWARFSLNDTISGKVNEGQVEHLRVDMEGIAKSALRPIGTAELENRIYEVKTFGEYIDSGTRIRIVKILLNQVIVEKIN